MSIRSEVSVALAAAALAALTLGGCSSSSSTAPRGGSLTVTITAPAGMTPSVTVNGPGGYHQTLSATHTLSGLAAGSYTVTAAAVRGTNAIVATVYTASVTGAAATVGASATAMASVSYAAQPGSGALWIVQPTATGAVSYTATQLAATTSAPPATALGTGVGIQAIAIDGSGNLWMTQDPNTVVEYTANELTVSGSPTPAVTLSATGGSLNYPSGLAFDGNGNLWVANYVGNTLVEFTATQLAATGSPTPAVTLSDNGAGSLNGPFALAFDPSGNLWIGNLNNPVVAFSPSQLTSSGSPTPAVTLKDDGSGSISIPNGLAFDGGGNLWIANFGANDVVEFTSSQLGSTGSPTPAVTLTGTTGGLNGPTGLAFDAGGSLWVANNGSGSKSVQAFAASQLATSGAPVATVTVSDSSITGPLGLAFDPPPANLPLK